MKKRFSSGVSRVDRLNGEFQRDIYEIITKRLKNPLITEMFSVLKVDTSKDLSHAKVYISIYSKNDEKKNLTFSAIKTDAKKIRFELSRISNTRTVPELEFYLDDSMEYSQRITKLINEAPKGEETSD